MWPSVLKGCSFLFLFILPRGKLFTWGEGEQEVTKSHTTIIITLPSAPTSPQTRTFIRPQLAKKQTRNKGNKRIPLQVPRETWEGLGTPHSNLPMWLLIDSQMAHKQPYVWRQQVGIKGSPTFLTAEAVDLHFPLFRVLSWHWGICIPGSDLGARRWFYAFAKGCPSL